MPAIIIGFAAGVVCFLALGLKRAFKFDDSLDVIAVHLVGGLLGTLMLGLFADPKVNGLVSNPGLFITDGGGELLKDQFVAAVVTLAFSFVVTFVIAKAIDLVMGLRVSEDEEDLGLDQTQHAESAYT
jgi:ammonium transporter, Amt family